MLFALAQFCRSCQSFLISPFCTQFHCFALNWNCTVHWFGINWHVLRLQTEIVACMLLLSLSCGKKKQIECALVWSVLLSTTSTRHHNEPTAFWGLRGKRGAGVPWCGVTGSRGTGSRGVENAGSGGKHGVRWKTRGLVENAGSGGKRGV